MKKSLFAIIALLLVTVIVALVWVQRQGTAWHSAIKQHNATLHELSDRAAKTSKQLAIDLDEGRTEEGLRGKATHKELTEKMLSEAKTLRTLIANKPVGASLTKQEVEISREVQRTIKTLEVKDGTP